MRSPGAPWIRRAVVAAALATTLVSAGCAGAAPGVVAYVGSAEISQKQVETAVAGVSTTLQEGQQVSTDAIINAMIHGEMAAQIAAEKRITITDGDRDTFLKGSNLAPLLNVPAAKPVAYDVADQQLVAKKLGAAAYLAEIAKRKVTLNPRYGVLDQKQKTIITDQSGSLAGPASVQAP